MTIRYALAAAILVTAVSPVLAAEFYVVQDTTTKKCTIVEKKPTVNTMVVVGGNKVYATRAEAEGAVKTITVCTN
jgi:hypothetical protein